MEEKDLTKSLEDKNIIEKHTVLKEDGTYGVKVGSALIELDSRLKNTEAKLKQAEEALAFLAAWWEEKHGNGLILPEQPKIII